MGNDVGDGDDEGECDGGDDGGTMREIMMAMVNITKIGQVELIQTAIILVIGLLISAVQVHFQVLKLN